MLEVGEPYILPQNRCFRYGEGIFETLRMEWGQILHFPQHMHRFFEGLRALRFDLPATVTHHSLRTEILSLVEKNGLKGNARIRLQAFRGEEPLGQFTNLKANTIIECFDLEPYRFPEVGLKLDIYEEGKKSTDSFANLKSNQYLLSVMSMIWAGEEKWDEAILMNCMNRVCETSKANIFCRLGNTLYTPPLSEGCVAGVIRRLIVENVENFLPYAVTQKPVTRDILRKADEVFITNAIQPIRWVETIGDVGYGCQASREIAQLFLDRKIM